MKILFAFSLVILLGAFLFPLSCDAAGLVPCGEAGNPCRLCHIFVLTNNIIQFFLVPSALNPFPIVLVIATLLFAIGGFMFFASAGNTARLEQGKKIITATVVGLLIVYGSWLFITLLLTAMGVMAWTGLGTWWSITC